MDDDSRISTLVHEITHALIFSSSYWTNSFFTDANGQAYGAGAVYVQEFNAFNNQQVYITTPKVLAVSE